MTAVTLPTRTPAGYAAGVGKTRGYVVPDAPTPGNRVGALFNYWCSLINNDVGCWLGTT